MVEALASSAGAAAGEVMVGCRPTEVRTWAVAGGAGAGTVPAGAIMVAPNATSPPLISALPAARTALTSSMLRGRASGSFSRHRSTNRSSQAGVLGRSRLGGGAGCFKIALSRRTSCSEWNGTVPASIS